LIDETNEYLSMNTRTWSSSGHSETNPWPHTTTLNDSCSVHAELEGTDCCSRRLWARSTIRSVEDSIFKFGRVPTNPLWPRGIFIWPSREALCVHRSLSRYESDSFHSVVEHGVMRRGRHFRTPRHRHCPHAWRNILFLPVINPNTEILWTISSRRMSIRLPMHYG